MRPCFLILCDMCVPQKPYLSLELEFHIFVENEIRTALALLAGSSNNE